MLEEVNNMLTATANQRRKTEATNTTETDDLKWLDDFLQDRRRDLVTRHKTKKILVENGHVRMYHHQTHEPRDQQIISTLEIKQYPP